MNPFRTRKAKLVAVTVVVLLVGAWLAFRTGNQPPLPLPNPNGYDDYVKAGQMAVVPASITGKSPTLSLDELRGIVATNGEALKLMREGLQHESRVPRPASPDLTLHFQAMSSFKSLAYVIRAEGQLAELEGRTNEAARIYLDNIRLGQETSRGGLMIDKLVGLAVEAMGRSAIQPLVTNLTARDCRYLIGELEKIEADKETAAEILANEKAWVKQTWPGYQRVFLSISSMIQQKSLNPNLSVQRSLETKCELRDIETGHLLIQLAARAYELEKGHPPKSVNDLSPEYLKSLPKSPSTGKLLPLPGSVTK